MHDLRLAVRSLRRDQLVSAIAILSLALGIGANAAIFALFSSVVSRPLPVRDPHRLALVSAGDRFSSVQQYSYTTFEQIAEHSPFIEGAFAYTNCCGNAILAADGQTTLLDRQYVSGDFFTTLGIRPLRGRLLTPADDQRGAPQPVVVISHRLWRDRFGERDDAVGSTIVVDRTPLTIVGVTPPDFFGVDVGRSFDILIPIRLAAALSRTPLHDDLAWLNVALRVKEGVSLETAVEALRAAQPQIRLAAMPKAFVNDGFLAQSLTLEPFASGTSALRQRFARPLAAIFALAVLVLLIAAANVGNLLVARGIDRRHEISLRTALGAPRWTLMRQIVVESSLLSAMGAAGGLLLAVWTAPLIVRVLSTSGRSIVLDVRPDWRLLLFLIATTAVTALLCALAPALKATRVAPMAFANEQGRGAATRGSGMADVLVVAQVAVSMVLLVVGGVFVQTFQRLAAAPLGFTADRVTVARVNGSAVPSEERVAVFQRLVDAVSTIPGVVTAGVSLSPPLVGEYSGDLVVSPPGTVPPPDAPRIPLLDIISRGWLDAYGVPVVAGRGFDDTDQPGTPGVMLVSEAFVQALSPDRSVLGTTLLLTFRSQVGDYAWESRTVVGVVADTVRRSARDRPSPAIFIPLSQYPGPMPGTTGYLGIKTAGTAPPSSQTIDDALRAVNGELAVTYQPLAEQVRAATSEDRLVADLSSGFAILGLLLAAVGIYGVTAYAAARQRREYGIRIALGASTSTIMRRVLQRVALLVGIGVMAGIVASLSGAALLRALVYGTDPRDPAIVAWSALVVIAVGLVAGFLPAYRAARTDPASVLKEV